MAPLDIDYLEAHGAGTELGDSLELRAIAAVYGRDRKAERPLLLGSVKTNIEHSEWASGMASIIKAVLAMNSGVIPAHLHFRNPNPNFEWARMPVRIISEMIAWPDTKGRPPLAGGNAFGLSGSNAHVILEGCAKDPASVNGAWWPAGSPQPIEVALSAALSGLPLSDEEAKRRRARLWPLSGKTPEALRDMAMQYGSWLAEHFQVLENEPAIEQLLANTAWTAGTGRSHFPYRKGLVFQDVTELQAKLKALSETASNVQSGRSDHGTPGVALLYSGQGDHWVGMGEVLYRTEPAFRAVLDQCDRHLREERNASLRDVMFGRDGGDDLNDRVWAWPAIYALEAALTALWESIGVCPTLMLSQGIGEIATAQASGALTLQDGLQWAASLTEPSKDLPQITVTAPNLTWVSSMIGQEVKSAEMLGNSYWRQLASAEVPSQDSIDAVAGTGADLTIELEPRANSDATSVPMLSSGQRSDAPVVLVDGTLHPGPEAGNNALVFLEAVAAAYEAGVAISFAGLFAGEERRRIAIPGYVFQRRSLWVQNHDGTR